jgi:hypothetical protein
MITNWKRQAIENLHETSPVKPNVPALPTTPKSWSCTPRSGNKRWSGIF